MQSNDSFKLLEILQYEQENIPLTAEQELLQQNAQSTGEWQHLQASTNTLEQWLGQQKYAFNPYFAERVQQRLSTIIPNFTHALSYYFARLSVAATLVIAAMLLHIYFSSQELDTDSLLGVSQLAIEEADYWYWSN